VKSKFGGTVQDVARKKRVGTNCVSYGDDVTWRWIGWNILRFPFLERNIRSVGGKIELFGIKSEKLFQDQAKEIWIRTMRLIALKVYFLIWSRLGDLIFFLLNSPHSKSHRRNRVWPKARQMRSPSSKLVTKLFRNDAGKIYLTSGEKAGIKGIHLRFWDWV